MLARKSAFSLENKKNAIIQSAIEEGNKKEQGLHSINILEKALNQKEKIKIVDSLDDICKTCNKRNNKSCKELIPYGISATSDDRAELHSYGLTRRVYTSKFIQRRLLERKA
jgi:hypothetical protein